MKEWCIDYLFYLFIYSFELNNNGFGSLIIVSVALSWDAHNFWSAPSNLRLTHSWIPLFITPVWIYTIFIYFDADLGQL